MIAECARYFAISEWIINGTCMCNGHAEACKPAPLEDPFPNKVRTDLQLVCFVCGIICDHTDIEVFIVAKTFLAV